MPFNPELGPTRSLKVAVEKKKEFLERDLAIVSITRGIHARLRARLYTEMTKPEHRDWLSREWQRLRLKFKKQKRLMPLKDVLPYFLSTLGNHLKLHARVDGRPQRYYVNDPDLLEQVFRHAAFDFIRLLRACAETGMTAKWALQIAELSHIHSPNDIRKVYQEYTELDQTTKNRALVKSPRTPKKILEHARAFQHLLATYTERGIPRTVVEAYIRTSDPVQRLEAYLDRYAELKAAYPSIQVNILRYAARHVGALGWMTGYVARKRFVDDKYGTRVHESTKIDAAMWTKTTEKAVEYIEWYDKNFAIITRSFRSSSNPPKPHIIHDVLRRNKWKPAEKIIAEKLI